MRMGRGLDVWSVALLDWPRGAQAALHRVLHPLGVCWRMQGAGACGAVPYPESTRGSTAPWWARYASVTSDETGP